MATAFNDAGELGDVAAYKEVIRQLGADGWLGIGWPVSTAARAAATSSSSSSPTRRGGAGAPIPFLTINTVGQTIMEFGTEEQKDFFLPRILAGELHFSIGYTEPGAGTDLASLRTTGRAGRRRVGDQRPEDLHVAGPVRRLHLAGRSHRPRRCPSTRASRCSWCRPTPPGFSYTPVHTMAGVHTSATFYDDVRVPVDNLVGELNGGWSLITNQLNHERVALLVRRAPDALARRRSSRGPRRPRMPTASASSTGVGAGAPRPGARAGSSCSSSSTGRSRRPPTTSPPPWPARRRSTAPSSPSRSTGL